LSALAGGCWQAVWSQTPQCQALFMRPLLTTRPCSRTRMLSARRVVETGLLAMELPFVWGADAPNCRRAACGPGGGGQQGGPHPVPGMPRTCVECSGRSFVGKLSGVCRRSNCDFAAVGRVFLPTVNCVVV